jgi:cell wall-associated NlpC family hydrolase
MRRGFVRVLLPGVAAAVGLVLTAGAALAGPTTGPADAKTARVQALTADVTGVVTQLQAAEDAVVVAQEVAAIALDEYQQRQQAYQVARDEAAATKAKAAQADRARATAQQELEAFARSSYIDGSTIPGAASLFTFDGPADLVERAVLLGSVGSGRADVLVRLTLVQEQADRADAAAQAALTSAAGLQERASAALASARTAQRTARGQQAQLVGRRGGLQQQLDRDVAQLGQLVGAQQAAAILAAARTAAAGSSAKPRSLGVLVGNTAIAGRGSSAVARRAIAAAAQVLGTAYAWGGGGAAGPGPGIDLDAGVLGFDCSGLTQYAYARAGVAIPRNSRAQYAALPKVAREDLRPGDLVFWARDPGNPDTIHHVAIWLGGDRVLQAPESGDVVQISPMWWNGYAGAVRPSA